MKELLSKYKLHVLVVLVGVVGLLWLNGTLKGCDVESLSDNSTSSTSGVTITTQPASQPITSSPSEGITTKSTVTDNSSITAGLKNEGTIPATEETNTSASKNVTSEEGIEN